MKIAEEVAGKLWSDVACSLSEGTCIKLIARTINKARSEGYAQAVRDAKRLAEDHEKIYHTYHNWYEEGMRDMADVMAQCIAALGVKK